MSDLGPDPTSAASDVPDLTEAPYAISERAALHYALRCDSWFDRLDLLAAELGLTTAWLTYTGLFATGADIPRLQSFYPGPRSDQGRQHLVGGRPGASASAARASRQLLVGGS